MISLKRLLHTLLPFMVMNMIQRSLLLLLEPYARSVFLGEVFSLAAFILSAGAAVFMFRQKTYTDESASDVPPLAKLPVGLSVMHTVISAAVMAVIMYAVSFLAGGKAGAEAQFTLLGIVSAVILHPVCEEIVFRKMFYGELRLMNPVFGCIAQALMFSILHSTVDGMVYALAGGIVLAVLYENTGRIETAVAAHAWINLRSVLAMTLLRDHANAVRVLDFGLMAAGVVCFIGCMMLAAPKKREAEEKTDEYENP